MDAISTDLARYRTHLAEKRTALSECQLAIVLITLPLTLHTALMLLAGRHPLASELLHLLPVFASILLAGIAVLVHALIELVRAQRAVGQLRRSLQAERERSKQRSLGYRPG